MSQKLNVTTKSAINCLRHRKCAPYQHVIISSIFKTDILLDKIIAYFDMTLSDMKKSIEDLKILVVLKPTPKPQKIGVC